jgi:hypothetical protein
VVLANPRWPFVRLFVETLLADVNAAKPRKWEYLKRSCRRWADGILGGLPFAPAPDAERGIERAWRSIDLGEGLVHRFGDLVRSLA